MNVTLPSIKQLSANQKTKWGFRLLFFLFVWLYLGIVKEDYLFKLQDNNFFIFDHSFVDELMTKQSWVIVLVARFILQFCYHPLLGASIISLLLSAMEPIVAKLFNIKERWFIIGFIPSIALSTTFSAITYEFFDIFDTAYAATNIIGFYFALLLFFIYKKCGESIIAAICITIASCIATPWMGCPSAMVTLLMIGSHALFHRKFAQGGIALVLGAIGIYASANFASYHILPAFIGYSLFFPWPPIFYTPLLIATIILHVVAILAITSHNLYQEKEVTDKFILPGNLLIGLLLIGASVLFCRYPNTLGEELRLQHLAHKSEWKQMVKEMDDMDVSSRVIAAYRVVALIATDQLSQKVFDYNYNYSLANFKKYNEEMVYYPELMLYASFPQISYRWCMEILTDGQVSMHILRIMALSAFMNEEYDLAKRYCGLLQNSLYYKEWAEDMLSHLNNPEQYIKKHPELKNIKKGRPFIETTGVVRGATTIYDRYNALPNISAERRLLTRLYRRNLDQFEKEVRLSPLMKKGLPRCMQEGLMIKAMLTNNHEMVKRYPIDAKVKNHVIKFIDYYQKHHDEENLPEKMKEKFGYSYSYYFAFGIGADYYVNIEKKKNEK